MPRKTFGKCLVADPRICHGKLTFKGTRILVADVLDLVAKGIDWGMIVKQCHGSITRQGIAEAVSLAGRAFLEHAEEYLKKTVSA
jgi:uncharacterized protein (DUF433 family)